MSRARLSVRREPSARGLARVCQAPRGYDVRLAGKEIARVRPFSVGFHQYDGWYWYGGSEEHGVPHVNTCNQPRWRTAEEARDACVAHIKAALATARQEER